MKSPALVLATILFTALFVACNEDRPVAPTPPDFDPADLVGRWGRSFEEESEVDPRVEWYRAADSRDFPPARFRMVYEFRADGRCEYPWLSPVDAHQTRAGTWDFDDADPKSILITDTENVALDHLSFRVVSVNDDLLRIDRSAER